MKYIRTPNGRILEWEKLNEVTRCVIDTCEEEVKEADTIEELCDEFVLVNENVFTKPQMLEDDYNKIDLNYYKNEDIYGAIWAGKGLIYVAKMNEKGELELL